MKMSLKPSPVNYPIINDNGQEAIIISASRVWTGEGSPARYKHGMCEAGNKKTFGKDGEYNVLIFNRLT